jgi:nucleoside-diphosphate-sugar epimerase
LVSRRGAGPEHPAIEKVAADASSTESLAGITEGAETLISCVGMPYGEWSTAWPPLGAALIGAAEKTGAVLLTTGNLYGYGAPTRPMTEQDEDRPNSVKGRVRATLWADALTTHREGRIRTAEIRGSDYLGAGVSSFFTVGVLPGVLRGKTTPVPADLDALHSWTYAGDVARTLIAVAREDSAWGRIWHVPTAPPVSVRELATRAAAIAGVRAPRLQSMPSAVLWLGGLFNGQAKEIRELQYQFRKPFVLDATAAAKTFGIEPVSTDEALRETVTHLRETA